MGVRGVVMLLASLLALPFARAESPLGLVGFDSETRGGLDERGPRVIVFEVGGIIDLGRLRCACSSLS